MHFYTFNDLDVICNKCTTHTDNEVLVYELSDDGSYLEIHLAGWSQDGEINAARILGSCAENRAHGGVNDMLEWAA